MYHCRSVAGHGDVDKDCKVSQSHDSYDRFCLRILEHATEKHPSTLSCSLLCACFWLVGLLRLLMTSSASSVTRVFCHVAPGVEPASLKTHAINYLTARIAWRAATVPRFNENTAVLNCEVKDGIESMNSKPTLLENQRKEREDIIVDEREAFYHATLCNP